MAKVSIRIGDSYYDISNLVTKASVHLDANGHTEATITLLGAATGRPA